MHTIYTVKPSNHTNRPNQPTSLKMKNMYNFEIFQPIWLKLGIESLNERTQHVHTIYTVKPSDHPNQPNQPTGLKMKNMYNFEIFQPIWLKLGIESLNGRTQHMHTIYPV